MDLVEVRDIYQNQTKYANQQIKIGGWVRTVRSSKSFGFLELNDGSFFKNIQVVLEAENTTDFSSAIKLNVGTAVIVKGILEQTPEAQQPFELKAKEVFVEGACDSSYPLQKKRHSFEFLRQIAYLRPRTNTFSAVFRVRSIIAYAIHTFFQEKGFVYVHTPIITGSDCEGAGEMFSVTTMPLKDFKNIPLTEDGKSVDFSKDFFGKETNLTVSGQLSGETFAMAFRNIYTFGPTFRAENSNTTRHAAEFWMVEPEMAFADLEDNMAVAEEMLKYIISFVQQKAPEEMVFFDKLIDKELLKRLDNVVSSNFGKITYTEAISLLEKANKNFVYPVKWGIDLQTEHERYLTEKVFQKPVFVTDYPKDIKAFYMRANDDGKTVAAMDLLIPGIGELIGGSQREERIEKLQSRMEELSMKQKDYWWYMNLRKYGGTRHAGFGLGFERAVMYLTGMTNIRDVIPYPRTVHNAEY